MVLEIYFCENNTITGNENDDIFSNDIETPVALFLLRWLHHSKINTTYSTSLSRRAKSKAPKAPNFQQRLEHPKGP
jgi:hypothetical protein